MKKGTWKTYKLSELADMCLGKMLDQKKNKGEFYPYLANLNVRWGKIDLEDLREMKFESKEFNRYGLKTGDIVMCEGGEPGRCAIWKGQRDTMMIQKALHRIRAKDIVDNEFLFYALLYKGLNGYFKGYFTGSAIKHLTGKSLAKINMEIPSIFTQRKIASILSGYDDLIENNLKRIKLLEEKAQLIYEEWFVRMKFPGWEKVMVDEETGLPKGWEKKRIGNICTVSGGGTPSKKVNKYWIDGNITWFSPTDLSKSGSLVQLDSANKITELGLQKSSAKLLQPNSFMMTSRATIGLFGIIDKPFSTNQGFINVTPNENIHKEYLIYNFKNNIQLFINYATGATFLEIAKTVFKKIKITWPSSKMLNRYHDLVKPIHQNMTNLTKQNQLLKEARDLLLPRLMMGMIDVDKIEVNELQKTE